MTRFFDILSLVYIPIGFLIGLVVLLILEMFDLGFWSSAGILLVAMILVIVFEYVANLISFNVFDWFLASKKEREMHARIDARDRRIGRIAFPLGMVMAFMAAQVWSPLEISKALF